MLLQRRRADEDDATSCVLLVLIREIGREGENEGENEGEGGGEGNVVVVVVGGGCISTVMALRGEGYYQEASSWGLGGAGGRL